MRHLVLIFLMIILGSCVKKVGQTQKYYLIDIPTVSKDSVDYSIALFKDDVCQIEEVDIFDVYATNQIAFRQETHEIIYYSYHYWAVKPDQMFRLMINNYLQKAGIFKSVSFRYWREVPDYQLYTYINHLEMMQDKKKLFAHLDLEFRLVNNNTDEIISSHSADRIKELEIKSMNLFASTISDLFYAELKSFSEKMKADFQVRNL